MKLVLYLIIFAILHIVFTVMCALLIKHRVLPLSMTIVPLIFFTPIWCVFITAGSVILTKLKKEGIKDLNIHEFTLEDNDIRRVHPDADDMSGEIVPLEEAIKINDVKLRRKLLLSILKTDPSSFIGLLKKVSINDDVEVTHYASTAMAEIQRTYELELQASQKALSEDPDNSSLTKHCIEVLGSYIKSGILNDSILRLQRNRYSDLLRKYMWDFPDDFESIYECADNELEMENFGEANMLISDLVDKYPTVDTSWMLKLKYLFMTKNYSVFKATINEIHSRDIYLSPESKKTISFWEES